MGGVPILDVFLTGLLELAFHRTGRSYSKFPTPLMETGGIREEGRHRVCNKAHAHMVDLETLSCQVRKQRRWEFIVNFLCFAPLTYYTLQNNQQRGYDSMASACAGCEVSSITKGAGTSYVERK